MRRIGSFLCVMFLLLSMANPAVFAEEATAAAVNGTVEFSSLQEAVDAYASGVIVLQQDAADLTVSKDVCLDLNGYDIANVTVTAGTLYCMDSQTDDYTVSDGVYGKLTGTVVGSVEAIYAEQGYLKIQEEAGVSFHRIDLEIYAMSLRAPEVGVYYKSYFAGDELVAANVEAFGVALSVVETPDASNLDTYCGYSVFENFRAGKNANAGNATGTLLRDIMRAANTDKINARNANMPIYGRAYIKTGDGYIFGAAVKRSLKQQMEAIDKKWDSLKDTQKAPIVAMYETFASVMDSWEIANIYDAFAGPGKGEVSLPVTVPAENGTVSENVTVSENDVSVTISAGTKLAEDATGLQLDVERIDRDTAIILEKGNVSASRDVHVDGLAADNTIPVIIDLGKLLPAGLKDSSVKLYHVENGAPVEMQAAKELTAHNQYTYDPATGNVTICIASFSEITAVAAVSDPWNGTVDTGWYDENATSYTITTAEQLAGLSQLVANDVTFAGKAVYLGNDLDLGGENGKFFAPIGHRYTDDKNGDGVKGDYYSGLYSFEGTFDGQGYTISNICQRTWDIKGDYDGNYYNDGMGLFGYVYNGTVKNLKVDNFFSEGEFAPTGVIAAYAVNATFDTITLTNCNPCVYNTGNGGIVGIGGSNEDTAEQKLMFENINIDVSNKISALWGSWDVGCAGVIGMYKGAGQVIMRNCTIAPVIDVYNDVTANYQYYQYRYSGMLIGAVGRDGDPTNEAANFTFENCKVYIGDWADYYYCEFEKNSEASYSEDFQFSRVERNEIVFNDKNMPVSCTHTHTPNEDKLALYLPFHQLYTGYGWGASPVSAQEGVEVIDYFYMITYMNAEASKVLDIAYATEGTSDENTNVADEYIITKTYSEAGKEFDGWVNAGSTPISKIPAGNRKDIVLFANWANEYMATFVDHDGNVIYRAAFTKNGFKDGFTPANPPDYKGFKGVWEEYNLKSANGNITIKPVYNAEDGIIKLTPVDSDGDGATNYYRVTNVEENDANIHIEIPAELNGVPVLEIADGAFKEFDNITTVRIPTSITYLGEDAFANKEGFILKYEQITFLYEGSYEQWKKIEKDSNWDRYVGEGSRIYFLADSTYSEETESNGVFSAKDREWSDPQPGTYEPA